MSLFVKNQENGRRRADTDRSAAGHDEDLGLQSGQPQVFLDYSNHFQQKPLPSVAILFSSIPNILQAGSQ
jgi:hypothetical protein